MASSRRKWKLLFPACAILGASVLGVLLVSVAVAQKQPPAKPINLNVASVKDLEQLPGVGPVTAKAIVQFRQRSGMFKRVEDLLVIRGVSDAKLKQMRPYVMVPPAAPVRAGNPSGAVVPARPIASPPHPVKP